MRVAIIGDYPLDPDHIWGGEQAAFSYLVEELCKMERLRVHIITPGSSEVAGQTVTRDDGSTLHVLPPFPRFELYRGFRTYRRSVGERLSKIHPDVVHAQGAAHHGYVALASGCPAVLTVHGIQGEDCKYQESFYLRFRKRLVAVLVERRNLQKAKHLIAINRYVTDYFSGVLNPGVWVHYIANAVKKDFFGLGTPSPGQTVLFAGRVIHRKRVLDLVRAFQRVIDELPAARLRIAGECESEAGYARRIQQFVESANLRDSIAMLGAVSERQILREFSNCDVLALPSAQETSPMVVAQAMAAGKPVIATPVGGVEEMVENGKTGLLVPVGDVVGLAGALRAVLEDPSRQLQMGEGARQVAEKKYRASVVARQTYKVYEEIGARP